MNLIVRKNMEKGILEFKNRPILCVCSSEKPVAKLVDASKKASKGEDLVLLLNYGEHAIRRVLPAYINARVRFAEGIARSRSMQLEMLMLVCGTMNIGKALKDAGVKNSGKFLAFATSDALLKRFAKANGFRSMKKVEIRLEPGAAGDVAMTELLNE